MLPNCGCKNKHLTIRWERVFAPCCKPFAKKMIDTQVSRANFATLTRKGNVMKEILENHAKWLKTRGKEGKRANLRDADLRDANLRDADLYGADMRRANLRDADLRDANLYGADLRGVNLSRADLYGADLHNANLHNANLRSADLYGAYCIASFGPVGDGRRIGYAVKHDGGAMVRLGCFWGDHTSAIEAIRDKYGASSTYEAFVTAACNEVMK